MTELVTIPTTLLEAVWQLLEWFFVTVFIKYILLKWVAEKIKNFLTRGRDDAFRWEHYRLMAMGHGHHHDLPEECDVGLCRHIKTIQTVDS